MNRRQMRVFFDGWFCGCGNPDDAARALLRLLDMHPMYEHWREFEEWVSDDGLQYLLLYILDRYELAEHGGSVGGAWLTPKGEALREGLRRESEDNFEALFEGHCIHGYSVEDDEHDCMKAGEPEEWPK